MRNKSHLKNAGYFKSLPENYYSKELEEMILSMFLVDNQLFPLDITEDHFYFEKHKKIIKTIQKVFKETGNTDIASVIKELAGEVKAEEILDIAERYITSAGYDEIIQNLSELKAKRDIFILEKQLENKEIDLQTFLDKAKQISYSEKKPTQLKEVMAEFVDYIDRQATDVKIIPCGIPTIDKHIGGFTSGDFITIAGRTRSGKTALLCNFAINMAEIGHSVCFFSLEMTDFNILGRILANKTGINSKKFRILSELNDEELSKILYQTNEIERLKFYIEDKGIDTLHSLEQYLRKVEVDVVIIDYIQRLFMRRIDNRAMEIDFIANRLKSLAKIRNCVIIAGAQLSRDAENTDGSFNPSLKTVKWGGGIEEASDFVFLLNTQKRTKEEAELGRPAKMEVILEKNRHGSPGIFNLDFYMETQRISDREENGVDYE